MKGSDENQKVTNFFFKSIAKSTSVIPFYFMHYYARLIFWHL